MLISKVRLMVQALSFIILTYGGRVGISLGFAVPCFSCPYVAGCGGYCFLMFLQRVGIFGIAAYDTLLTYIGLKNILWFVVFAALCIALSRFWCGWICPFGTLMDMLSWLRRKMGIRQIELSWRMRDAIRPIKYIFLAIIFIIPFFVTAHILPDEMYILFCRICPAKPLMPLFVGETRNLGLDYRNWLTLVISIISVSFAAITVVGCFFKDRFFCLICPMLPLIKLFDKLTPWQFNKHASACSGCGNCMRMCCMDIRQVYQSKEDGSVMTEDCILCTQCMQACPSNKVLELKVGSKVVYSSSKKLLSKDMSREEARIMIENSAENMRKQRRYEKILQKTMEEYRDDAAKLRAREDFIPEYDYFLQLVEAPFRLDMLKLRVNKPIVGLFCIHAPLELLDAMDLHGVKLCSGSHTVQRVSASYLPVLMCPMLKAFMGNFDLQNSSFDDYKAIILPTTCDWVVKLPEIMQQPLDKVHYLELPHLKESEKSQNRWLEEIYELVKILEQTTDRRLVRKALEKSIDKYMKVWSLIDELTDLKRRGLISGTIYTTIMNSFMLDDVEKWMYKLSLVIDKASTFVVNDKKPGIFMAGSPIIFPNLKLLELAEQAGMRVVADDLCSSERALPGGVVYKDTSAEGMLRALAERYHKACVCPTFADNDRRINNILSITKENNLKGVVFNLLKGCHPYDIEAITIEKKLKEHGLKFLKLETDYGKEDSQNILTRLEAFRQTL